MKITKLKAINLLKRLLRLHGFKPSNVPNLSIETGSVSINTKAVSFLASLNKNP